MNKAILAAACLIFGGMTAFAQWNVTPPQGAIDLVQFPAGLTSVSLSGPVEINREANGFATLTRNGEVLKELPASNEERIYCTEGFDKVTYGSAQIDFFTNQGTSPARLAGTYHVSIPAGFFKTGADRATLSPELEFDWTIAGTADNTYSPASGSSLSEISGISLVYPEGATIEFTDNSTYQGGSSSGEDEQGGGWAYSLYLHNATSGNDLKYSSYEINGNVITFKWDPAVTTAGTYTLLAKGGCLKVTYAGTTSSNTADAIRAVYTVEAPADWTVTPAAGTFESLKSQKVADGKYAYFTFKYDEASDVTVGFVMAGKPQLAPVVDGEVKVDGSHIFALSKTDDKTLILQSTTYSEKSKETTLNIPDGTYHLVFPANCFQQKVNGAVAGYNAYMDLGEYVFKSAETPVEYSVTPDPSYPVSQLRDVHVIFPKDTELSWKSGAYAHFENGSKEYSCLGEIGTSDEGYPEIVITLPRAIGAEGEWTLVVPSGILLVNGKPINFSEKFVISPLTATANCPGELIFIPGTENELPMLNAELEANEGTTSAEITVNYPTGYDVMYWKSTDSGIGDANFRKLPQQAEYWLDAEAVISQGFTASNVIVVPADGKLRQYGFYLGAEGKVDTYNMYLLQATVKDKTSGVAAIETVEAGAEYFNLQGVRVTNPVNGMFIKVADGKVSKVVVK